MTHELPWQDFGIDHMTGARGILILGAGRSGTSTLARGLIALNVTLGRRFRRPVRKNPRGQFEEVHLLSLSKSVRNALGLRADSVRLLSDQDWQEAALEPLRRRVRDATAKQFGKDSIWAFKYGSTGRILPFWFDILPDMGIEPSFVFAYRNPLSVARSRGQLDAERGRVAKNNFEWLVNVVPYFHLVRGYRTVVVDYDLLISEPDAQLRRLAAGLGVPVTPEAETGIATFEKAFLRKDLQHSRFTDADLVADPDTHQLVRRAAHLLAALARDERGIEDEALWTEWQEIQKALQELAPTLALVDALSADVRRASWWDLRKPLRLAWRKMPLLRVR